MRIGQLRHRIEFRQHNQSRDDYGQPLEHAWAHVNTVFASKEPILGKEYFAADTIQSNVTVKFRCRYFPGVTNDMQIWHDGEKYHIESAINVKDMDRELSCYCSKVVTVV